MILVLAALVGLACSEEGSSGGSGGSSHTGGQAGAGGGAGQGGAGAGGTEPLGKPVLTGTACEPMSHGQSCTIAGDHFGAKDPVAPLLWDNAEDLYGGGEVSDGALVPVDDDVTSGYPWRVNEHDRMHFATESQLPQRGVSQAHYFGEPTGDNHKYFRGYDYNPDGVGHGYPELYVTWYIKTDTETTAASTKLIRLWANDNNGRTYRLSWTTSHLTWSYSEDVGVTGNEWATQSHDIIADDTPGRWNTWDGETALNEWHRNEVYYRQSSTADTADGQIYITTDGAPEYDFEIPTWLDPWEPCSGCIRPGQRGGNNPLNHIWVFGLDPSVSVGDYLLELDDIYIDRTPARVEICAMASWADRAGAHCEVQHPVAWSDESIEVTVNRGSFPSGPAYLYVVNSANEVNAQGLEVTFD